LDRKSSFGVGRPTFRKGVLWFVVGKLDLSSAPGQRASSAGEEVCFQATQIIYSSRLGERRGSAGAKEESSERPSASKRAIYSLGNWWCVFRLGKAMERRA